MGLFTLALILLFVRVKREVTPDLDEDSEFQPVRTPKTRYREVCKAGYHEAPDLWRLPAPRAPISPFLQFFFEPGQ